MNVGQESVTLYKIVQCHKVKTNKSLQM